MEAVVFCGIQASGKTTFYLERFFKSHVRLNLDMLKTRHRERVLLNACLETGQRFVVDNTQPDGLRKAPIRRAGDSGGLSGGRLLLRHAPREAIARNESRPERERVPISGLLGTYKRQEVPSPGEGFHRLFRVRTQAERFLIEDLE